MVSPAHFATVGFFVNTLPREGARTRTVCLSHAGFADWTLGADWDGERAAFSPSLTVVIAT